MDDLISRSTLLDDMQKELEKAVNSGDMTEFECEVIMTSALALKDFVNRQPTVEAMPVVHAEWKYSPLENIATCKNCSYEHYLGTYHQYATNFCPRCGADMRKKV